MKSPEQTHLEDYRRGRRGAWVGILGNLLLCIAKALGGWASGSASIVADAVHSLSDTVSSVAVLVGMHLAAKPADEKHPYGHGRAESIAAKAVSMMLIMLAVGMIWNSTMEIVHHRKADPPGATYHLALWVGLASIAVKELLFRYKYWLGKSIGSTSIVADAWHHRSDALSSVVAVIAIALTLWGGERWAFMDHVGAIGVALIILGVGIGMFRKSWTELMDTMASPEQVHAIREVARSVPGVLGVEQVVTRKAGLDLMVDLHAEVDPSITVDEGHQIASRCRDRIINTVPHVRRVLVHVEPYYKNDH